MSQSCLILSYKNPLQELLSKVCLDNVLDNIDVMIGAVEQEELLHVTVHSKDSIRPELSHLGVVPILNDIVLDDGDGLESVLGISLDGLNSALIEEVAEYGLNLVVKLLVGVSLWWRIQERLDGDDPTHWILKPCIEGCQLLLYGHKPATR